jgi:hypothetical protein
MSFFIFAREKVFKGNSQHLNTSIEVCGSKKEHNSNGDDETWVVVQGNSNKYWAKAIHINSTY